MKRAIATRSGDRTVAEVLVRAGADDRAVEEGRVFVGRRRVRRGDEPVSEGESSRSRLRENRQRAARVIWREDDVVAVDKPAGMPTIADHAGAAHALVAATARALGLDAAKPAPDVAARPRTSAASWCSRSDERRGGEAREGPRGGHLRAALRGDRDERAGPGRAARGTRRIGRAPTLASAG